eukprot:TRINITY_DN51709_c0_g1_i1.p2 TRINITY_DN51709_c0_g1~~TRINITY_DN51709_c0_g1_i1.p2  ORF type:complete len:199 (+),score=81.49 TRINITY_DN51709_c0_g1_i1:120-716(+)
MPTLSSRSLTQQQLDQPDITTDEVLQLTGPTDGFLCSLDANKYGIEFLAFKIRNMETGEVLFEVDRDAAAAQSPTSPPPEDADEATLRTVRYDFPSSLLQCSTVGTKLVFAVGESPVPNFRMIERHYFRDRLVKNFDFNFGFCIPNSTNSWEAIYDMPRLPPEEEEEIMKNPFETRSDSFYFVADRLVMHNKAEYSYQ